jgi:hypothetical protein
MNTLYSTKHLYPTVTRGGLEEVTVHCFHLQSRSKLMPAMYSITHKIFRLSQVVCANGSRKLFRFRLRQFSGLKYYFTWEITPFRNLFSVFPGFRYIGGMFRQVLLYQDVRSHEYQKKVVYRLVGQDTSYFIAL